MRKLIVLDPFFFIFSFSDISVLLFFLIFVGDRRMDRKYMRLMIWDPEERHGGNT